MRNSKKRVRSCLSVILMFGMLLSYVPPVMAIDEVDEAVIAQEEPLATEDSSALEEEREDTEQPEPTKERDEETYSEETPVDSTPAGEGSAEKMPVQKMPVQEMPVQEAPAEEAPAEEPASEEAFAEEGEQPEEILYTLTYSGLSDSAELEVRKLDPEDKDDADAISKLQKQLEEQELYDAFEISLTDGEILDEEAGARVTLHGYEVEDPEQTALYHFTDDGEIEELVYSAVDDEVSFVTKSFSPFVFAQAKEQEEQPDEAPAEEQPDEAPAEEQPDEVPAEEQEQQALDLKMKNLLSTGADNGSDSDISIDTFRATLRSGATKNDSGDYVWRATNSYADHAFIFRVTYSLSGTYEYQPGEIEIRIPKSILLNRNGKSSDYYELSIPSYDAEGLTGANVYVYKVDGDDIVIYNRIQAPAAQNGYFEVSYSTAERTYEYADYDPGHTGTETGSAPFSAEITITQNEVTQKAETTKIPVYIDTTAKITGTTKYTPTYYTDWNNSWGTRPNDADKYYYLVWEVRSIISGTTQPYKFSLADNFNVTDGKVVGYRMQGQTGYTSNGTVENLKTDYEYGRYDYVLTRHSKETYNKLVEYTVTNTVTATVDPADQVDADTQAVSSRSWTYEKPTFERPTGHFYMYKWGLDYRDDHVYDSEDIRRFDLSDYVDKKTNTIPDLAYYTYVHGYPYPWTVPAGESMDKPENYGKEPVTYELIDNELYLKAISGSYTDQLTAYDYQIDKITLDWYMQDAEYNKTTMRFEPKTVDYTEDDTEDDVITVYAQFGGGGDWVEIGAYNLNTNQGTVTADDDYGVSFSGKDLVFANTSSICTGYRLVTSNAHYYTLLGAYPHVTLKRTETVNQVVQAAQDSGQLKIALLNRDHGNVYKGDGTEEDDRIIGFVRNGIDYVIGVIRQGDIQKNVIGYRNDTVNRQYRITWSVEASESYLAEGNRRVYVNQESGTFYDLLPLGGLYVPDSVIAYADGIRLSDGQYSVKTVENYRHSGHTMLIVQYNVPADKYYFTYSTSHAWDVILEYGRKVLEDGRTVLEDGLTVLNSVAYETGNEDIGRGSKPEDGGGRPDDGGTIKEKTLMADLDPATDANKFIYAQAGYEINDVTAGSLGLYKQVRAAQDTAYSYSTKTYSDSDYSYRIRFATDVVTKAKDLILFDSLENYQVAAGANAGATSDWHGVLTGFDLSVPEKLGIRPVVYYSTAKNLSIRDLTVDKNYNFAEHSEIWVSAQDYTGNLSDVKAFAIDLRYDKDGDSYILPTDTPVSVTVFMHSPKSITSQAQDPTAYNNIYLYNSVTDAKSAASDLFWTSELNQQDYTQIRYRMVGDLKILKVDSTDETTPVEGIVFRLWGTSHYGTEVDETMTTNRYGRITFKNIEYGTYFLQEVDGVADYQQDHIQMTVTVDENGDVHIGVPDGGQDGTITYKTDVYGNLILDYNDDTKTYIIGNEPRIHGDLEFVKKVTIDGKDNLRTLPGVTFQLSGTSDYGNDILMLLTSDESGTVSIQNLELGSYEMTEIAVPDGTILSRTVYTVRCDSSGILSISYTDSEGQEVAIPQDKSGDYVVVNEPTHSFTLWKMDPVNNEALPGATFTLTGTSDYETPVDMEVTSDANGMVTFDGLEPGSYVLKETVAPANHVLDGTPRKVTIESNGKVTIDGLTQLVTGWFPVENERSSEGVITITKAWSDSEAENRPIPVIHLDTEAPTHSLPVATISSSLWRSYVNDNTYGSSSPLRSSTSFTQNTTATKEEVTASGSGWIRIDDQTTDYSIYFKLDGEAAYWWSDASIVYFPVNSCEMFFNCSKLKSLDVSGFDTSKVTNMSYMFFSCSGLKSLDLSGFDTSNVTNMSSMFYGCSSLTSLYVSGFDTSNVTNMSYMFFSCSSLPSLDVSNFKTSNVTNMRSMFSGCSSLPSLDVTGFDTYNVTNMSYMFDHCYSLPSLDVSNFKTSNVTNMSGMFNFCTGLLSLDVSKFNTSKVTNMGYMFDECSGLTSLDVSNFNTSKVTSMSYMFSDCRSLTSLDVSGFNTSNVTDMDHMFYGCSSLTSLNVSGFDTSNVTKMSSMFSGCRSLTSLDLRDFDTSKVTSMSYMFYNCSSLTSLDVSRFNTSKVTNMKAMFSDCYSLTSLNVSNFNTSNVTDMSYMFSGCSGLTSLDVSEWKTGSVKSMGSMFSGCENLKSLNVSGWNTSSVESMDEMFASCKSLRELDLSNWSTGNVTSMSNMFGNCEALTILDVSKWSTGNVTIMSYMFNGCEALKSLDLSNWSTGNVTSMSYMFGNCEALTILDVSKWSTGNVTSMSYMFNGCEALKSLDLSSFDTSKVRYMGYMFNHCEALQTIYAGSGWNTGSVSSGNEMFTACTALVGGNGTRYDSTKTDKTYACIDTDGQPGYLTQGPAPSSTPTPGSRTAPAFSAPTPAKAAGENVAINQTSESKMYEGDKPEEAYNQWVKNGDGTWTYRFNVYDGDATYYIWEEALPGYTSDTDAKNPVEVTYTEGGTLTSGDDRLVDDPVTDEGGTVHHNYSVKITNTKDDGTTAALTVKKTVTGGTAADREKLFTFTVTLSDKSVTGYYGDMPFVKGVATVKLKHGQSATATGLPNDVGYTVVEKEANQDGFETTKTEDTGTLEAGETATAAFTNAKQPDEPPPPEPETGGLQVTKTVVRADGEELTDAEKEKKFTFTITLNDTGINGLYGDLIFKNGVATAYLAHGETVTVSGLPVDVAYTVKEETYKGYTTSYTGETGTIQQGETQAVKVTNTKEEVPANGFTLKKLVSGTPSAEPFTFFIDFAGLDPNSSYGYVGANGEHLRFTSAASGAARVSVKLNDNQTAVFDGLPVGSTYTVTESASGYVASYTVTNGSESGAIASPSGANRSSGLTLQTAAETVDEGEQITVTFVNTSPLYDISFIKYGTDGMFLDGALLQVLDSTGKVYAEWRSTGDIDTVQLPEGSYTLHEAEAPEGYTLAADITFTVGENGAVTVGGNTAAEVAMTDVETKVIISKEDGYGRPVAGAKLQIVDADGNVVYSWVSGSEAREITGVLTVLTPYTLREVSAPNGYARAQDIPFILDSDGTVYIGDSVKTETKAENLTIVMNDYKSISLPLSGSRSELACMLFGCAMITAGGLYAARRRRREAKVRSNIGKRGGRICK